MGEIVSRPKPTTILEFLEEGVVVMVSYGRTFDPVEHINPLMVLEGGKVSHAVCLVQCRIRIPKDPRGYS